MAEGFFNEQWADKIQLVSIWLETLGLALVVIELFKSQWADKIEDAIDKTEQRTRVWFGKLGLALPYSVETEKRTGLHSGFGLRWIVTLYFVGQTVWYITDMVKGETLDQIDTVIFLFGAAVATLTIAYYLLKGLHSCIHFLNKLTNGHALGSIGLLLAILGFLGEVYQVITMKLG